MRIMANEHALSCPGSATNVQNMKSKLIKDAANVRKVGILSNAEVYRPLSRIQRQLIAARLRP